MAENTAHLRPQISMRNAQKIHNGTRESQKMGTPKIEETNPLKTGRISVEYKARQRLTSNRLSLALCAKYPHFLAHANQPVGRHPRDAAEFGSQ